MDGFRLDPSGDIARLPPEQRRRAEIEAAWQWHDCHARRDDDRCRVRPNDRTTANRDRLAEAQNWRCCYCGVRMAAASGNRRATFEHILPRALGGSNLIGNLVISCWDCNNKRGMQMRPEHTEVLALLDEARAQG